MSHYTKALEEGKSELGKLNIFSAQIPNKEDGLRTFVIDVSDVVSFLPQFAEKIRQAVAEDDVEWCEGKKYTFKKCDWGDGMITDEPVEGDGEICLAEAEGYNQALTEIITHKREQLTKE